VNNFLDVYEIRRVQIYNELRVAENCGEDLPLVHFSEVYLQFYYRSLRLAKVVYNTSTHFTCQVTMIHRLSPLHQNIRAVAIKSFLNLLANCNKRLHEIYLFFDCENKSVLILLIVFYTELGWCVLISQTCKTAIVALMSVSCQRDEVSNDTAFTGSLGNPSLSR